MENTVTKTEQLLIEAREIARRVLGKNASEESIGRVFDVLVLEHMPSGDASRQDEDERTLH